MSWIHTIALAALLGGTALRAQEPRWTADVTGAWYVEAWDLNDDRERLGTLHAGVDRVLWRGLAVRVEGVVAHVGQARSPAWLGGATLGARIRHAVRTRTLFFDLAAGRGSARHPIPPGGTHGNYILLAGAGVDMPLSFARLTLGARWLHLSNNGSHGRARNPDIQSIGGFGGVGWRF